MPTVVYQNGKKRKFPYTPQGVNQAAKSAQKNKGRIIVRPDSTAPMKKKRK